MATKPDIEEIKKNIPSPEKIDSGKTKKHQGDSKEHKYSESGGQTEITDELNAVVRLSGKQRSPVFNWRKYYLFENLDSNEFRLCNYRNNTCGVIAKLYTRV